MKEPDNEIVTYHSREVLPLYNLPYEVIIGKTMADCVAHGESIFPGASLKKALEYDHYVCKMTHPDLKTRYMVLIEVIDEAILASITAKLATEMSWYLMDEVKIQCDNKNNDTQGYFVMTIFNQVSNVIGTFLNKINPDYEDSDDDIGDL